MRIYICYLLSSILNFLLIIFYWGVSAGLANYSPIIALVGTIILLVLALPAIVYTKQIGLILGSIGCSLILVYELPLLIMNLKKVVLEHKFQWEAIGFSMPAILAILSTYFTVKALLKKDDISLNMPSNRYLKGLLAAIPLVLFFLYIIFYGRYWSWDIFSL